jgi:hypothetical protein
MDDGLRLRCAVALSLLASVAASGCGGGGGPSCLRGPAEAARAEAKVREAHAFTRASFERAVAARGLRVLDLELYSPNQLVMSEELAKKVQSGQVEGVFSDEIDGKKITYYRAGGSMLVGTTVSPRAVPFAVDGAGGVYEVVHRYRETSKETLVLCGCPPVGSGVMQRYEGPPVSLVKLPEGSTFRGQVEIAHDLKSAGVVHDGQAEDGKRCSAAP